MKRFYSVLLAIMFIMQGGAVLAANEEAGWNISYHGENNTDRNTYFAEVTTERKYDGEQALAIKYPGYEKDADTYAEVKNTLTGSMQTGKYTLTFYNKRDASKHTEISIGDQKIFMFSDMTKTSAAAPSGDKGWSRYSITFDYQEQEESFFSFRFYAGTETETIDNVSLIMEGTETNLIADDGFEEYVEEVTEEEYDTTDYRPAYLMASPNENNGLVLNWRNPVSEELQKIEVYDVTGGQNILMSDSVELTPSKIIYYEINDLELSKEYQYKLIFYFKGKENGVYFINGTPASAENTNIGNWDAAKNRRGAAGFCPISVAIDANEENAHSGKSSLKIVGNVDRNIKELQSNIFSSVIQTISMKTGKKYRVSFWMKGEKVLRPPQVSMNFAPFDGKTGLSVEMPNPTFDWTYYEYTYTFVDKNAFLMVFDGTCDGLWFDDISIVELDDSGEAVGTNLLKDSGFEDVVSKAVGEITDFKAEGGAGSVNLSWTSPSGAYEGANIYQLVFGKYEYRGRTAKGVSSVNVTGLQKNKEYTFKVVPFNADGIEGEGQEASALTILPDYEVYTPTLYKDGETAESLNGAGNYKISIPVKNNLKDDGVICEAFAAVYKDGALTALYSAENVIKKTKPAANPTNVVVEFDIPDGTGYHMEFYLIDSREGLNHLCGAYVY